MKKVLIDYFTYNDIEGISYNNIKKMLGISKKHLDEDLNKILEELEINGIIYHDINGLYKSFPKNYLITNIYETKKCMKYIEIDDIYFSMNEKRLKGANSFDKVIVKKVNDEEYEVDKILVRNLPEVVCEVRIKDGIKYLYPINTNNNLKVVIGSKDMKKLVEGTRALVKVSKELYDEDIYDGEFVKIIGYKNEPDIDFKTILYSCGFDDTFSKESLKELESIPTEVTEEDIKGRVDLRDLTTFTIDGKDCKDMDDAISIKRDQFGNFVLFVHIAPVSYYVNINSSLFKDALKRSTSVYFPDAVSPMFPPEISNGICSLNEGVDRLTRTVMVKFNKEGKILEHKQFRSVINSNKKMNYDDVNKVLKGEQVEGYEPFFNDLKNMEALSSILNEDKKKRGYICIDKGELKFDLDSLGNTKDVYLKSRIESEDIIENFMLTANQIIAENNLCCYRCHPGPSSFRINELFKYLKELGYHLDNVKNLNKTAQLQSLLNYFKDKEEYSIIAFKVLKSLKRAYYDTENIGHFGLAIYSGYTHFTSPIRRIADYLNHYILDLQDDGLLTDEKIDELMPFLKEACETASRMERQADVASYKAEKLQMINYLKQHKDEPREVFIDEIFSNYIAVRSKDLMDGIIYYENILNDKLYMLPSGKIKSSITGRYYKVGHKLLVNINDASYVDQTISYNLIDNLTLKEAFEKIENNKTLTLKSL